MRSKLNWNSTKIDVKSFWLKFRRLSPLSSDGLVTDNAVYPIIQTGEEAYASNDRKHASFRELVGFKAFSKHNPFSSTNMFQREHDDIIGCRPRSWGRCSLTRSRRRTCRESTVSLSQFMQIYASSLVFFFKFIIQATSRQKLMVIFECFLHELLLHAFAWRYHILFMQIYANFRPTTSAHVFTTPSAPEAVGQKIAHSIHRLNSVLGPEVK